MHVQIFEMMDNYMKATGMRISDLFRRMDYDGEGTISFDEMQRSLLTIYETQRSGGAPKTAAPAPGYGDEVASGEGPDGELDWFDALITEFDKSNDDVVTKIEFATIWARLTKDLDKELPEGNSGRTPRDLVAQLRLCVGEVKEWFASLDTSAGQDKLVKAWQLWIFLRKCNNGPNGTIFDRLDADRIIQYFSPQSDGTCSLLDIEDGFGRAFNPSREVKVALANSRFIRAVNVWFRDNQSSTNQIYNSWDIVNFNKCRLTKDQLIVRLKDLGLKAGVSHDDVTPWLGRRKSTSAFDETKSSRVAVTDAANLDGIAQKVEDIFSIADEYGAGAFNEAAFEKSFRKVRQIRGTRSTTEDGKSVMEKLKKLTDAANMSVEQFFFALIGCPAMLAKDRERYLSVEAFNRGVARLGASVGREELVLTDIELESLVLYVDDRRRGTFQLNDIHGAFDRATASASQNHAFATFAWLEKLLAERHMKVRTLFDIVDTDCSGLMDRAKLTHALQTDFKPAAKWSVEDESSEEKYGALLPLVYWLDTNEDGIVERCDFPGKWRKITEIASYERPEARALVQTLEILIYKTGKTVPEWYGEFQSPEGLTPFQLCNWLDTVSANPGDFSQKDCVAIIKYVDRKNHSLGTLVQFQATFQRLHQKPTIEEEVRKLVDPCMHVCIH